MEMLTDPECPTERPRSNWARRPPWKTPCALLGAFVWLASEPASASSAMFVRSLIGLDPAGRVVGRPDTTPAALVDGERVEWSDLVTAMTEAAGGAVLEEVVLDRLLRAECDRLQVPVGDTEVEAEREQLGRSLASVSKLPETEGETLIQRIRTSRGLGEARFPALLRRNAMLRALVRSGKVAEGPVRVLDEDLRQAYSLKYGPRVRARLILVRTPAAADQVLRRVRPDIGPGEPFGEVAFEMSIDPTAGRGGLLEPLSLDDASYPVAIRRVLSQMEVGAVSDPIQMETPDSSAASANARAQTYAVVRLEERVAAVSGAPTPEDAAASLRTEVQIVRERAAMDRLARRLVQSARITIFDRALDKSWVQRDAGAAR